MGVDLLYFWRLRVAFNDPIVYRISWSHRPPDSPCILAIGFGELQLR